MKNKKQVTSDELTVNNLRIRIDERKLIIYVLESALADNEPKVPKPYKICMKDEIQNHKYAIEDYENDIKRIKMLANPMK